MNFSHALDGLAGRVPEFPGWPKSGVTQAFVDARWNVIAAAPPAPLLPSSLIGKHIIKTKFGARVEDANGKLRPKAGIPTKEEMDFLNFFGKIAIDPYRKQSDVSKVAGGILQVAAVVVPVFGVVQAAATAGNAAFEYGEIKGDQNQAARVLAPALAAQAESEKQAVQAQISKLQALAPKGVSESKIAQENFAAARVVPIAKKAPASNLKWLALAFGFGALLIVVRR